MEWIPETEKGRTGLEFTPLSMYLRDCRAATLIRSRSCPIGGRFANSVRRSPEFIARTVLLPERFRVDCAVGGETVALSHSRCDYNATRARLARQSSLGCVATAQRGSCRGCCNPQGLEGSTCRREASEPRLASARRSPSIAWARGAVSVFFTLDLSRPIRELLNTWFHGRFIFGHEYCSVLSESGFVEDARKFLPGFPKPKTCEAH